MDYSFESNSRRYAAPAQAAQAKLAFNLSIKPGEKNIAKYQAAAVLRKNAAASFKNRALCLFFICYLQYSK
jgi:hypothetical protein